MASHQPRQANTANIQLAQGWQFYFYFSPPTWSAGTRGVVVNMTT